MCLNESTSVVVEYTSEDENMHYMVGNRERKNAFECAIVAHLWHINIAP